MKRRNVLIGGGVIAVAGAGATAFSLRQMGSMGEYEASVAETRSALSERPETIELIRYATLAASGHNTQPWRFQIAAGGIKILPDLSRRTPVVDPDDHHLYTSLGCASENLAIAASARGRSGDLSFDSADVGSVYFAFGGASGSPSPLFGAIARRQSTRAEYDGRAVSSSDLRMLTAAAAIPGVDFVLITDRPQIERVRDLVVTGNSVQMANDAFVRELKSWLRFNPREALLRRDGLFSATTGNPSAPSWLGPVMFDRLFRADAENEKYAAHLRSSSGVAIFVSQKDDPEHWIMAGRACQRFALQATALGLKHAFVNQPVEVAHLRPELAALVGLPGRRPDVVMRFGYGPTLPFSARRPVDAVLV